MLISRTPKKNRSPQEGAQAIVEFAIALPILMFMLVGILEVGRMMFIYASVTNASREAVRYASAVGFADGTTYKKYQYCVGIRDVAQKAAFLANLSPADITIAYDHGSLGSTFDYCDINPAKTSVTVNSGTNYDRVTVSITATYRPMVNLIPIGQRTFTSRSSRSILGIFELASDPGGGGGSGGTGGGGSDGGGNDPTATFTPTATLTGVPTETPTPKHPTNTPAFVASLTPVNTPTPTSTATSTATATATATFTSIPTSTPTFTPTSTPTAVMGCGSITHGAIVVPGTGGNKTMSMTISNPNNYAVSVLNIQVTWNSASGGPGNPGALYLKSASLGSTFWSWSGAGNGAPGPSYTITPSALTIPGNNTPSTLMFTFDANYQNSSGNSITINLSTPGCESTPIHNP